MENTRFYVDEKVTIWRRTWYESDTELTDDRIVESYQDSNFTNSNLSDSEVLYETEELMSIEENDGQSTVEVYNESGKLIWSNV